MDWVLSNLAVGNFHDAEARDLCNFVDTIICIRESCGCNAREDVSVFSKPLIDGNGNRANDMAEILDHVHEALTHGDRVLVHCHAGRSRSVAVVARYLMVTQALTREQAIQKIRAVRDIQLTPGIESVLRAPWTP